MSSHETLKELAADARARVPNPPTWDQVREDAARLSLGAAHAEAAVVAGLMTDEIRMMALDHWPADINDSLRHLKLFDKYSPTTLHGVFQRLSAPEIKGLTNHVKGTVFEWQTVAKLNHGELPLTAGATHAELISPLNHPGSDIRELGADGHMVAEIQAKATDNWHVIAKHLHRYPQFPTVATTHEGAQTMLQHGVDAHHVLDTGIHAQALHEYVAAHMDNLGWLHFSHELVPEVAFLLIAVAAGLRLKRGDGLAATVTWVKEQATIAGLANAAGLAVQLVTGTVALRPFAAIGTRFTAERGSVAQRTGAALRRVNVALGTLRESAESHGYAVWSPPVAVAGGAS